MSSFLKRFPLWSCVGPASAPENRFRTNRFPFKRRNTGTVELLNEIGTSDNEVPDKFNTNQLYSDKLQLPFTLSRRLLRQGDRKRFENSRTTSP
jgi:hypothetical protein